MVLVSEAFLTVGMMAKLRVGVVETADLMARVARTIDISDVSWKNIKRY